MEKVVILVGGMGTRLQEETSIIPKPMVEIGGKPILWHIMKIFSTYGFEDFVLALGYKGQIIKQYFVDYCNTVNDFAISLANGDIKTLGGERDDWHIQLIDTGLHTQTGGRLRQLRPWLSNSTFMMTYGDGVANIDVGKLLAWHRQHGKLATVTAVRPPARFGGLVFDGHMVEAFTEKPQVGEGWINGGFFVLEPQVIDYIVGDETVWEKEPLERLAEERQLVAYRHDAFWQPMDTLRDVRLLESLWQSGNPPWRMWDERS